MILLTLFFYTSFPPIIEIGWVPTTKTACATAPRMKNYFSAVCQFYIKYGFNSALIIRFLHCTRTQSTKFVFVQRGWYLVNVELVVLKIKPKNKQNLNFYFLNIYTFLTNSFRHNVSTGNCNRSRF